MFRIHPIRRAAATLVGVAAALCCLSSRPACAQAWLPDKGEGTAAVVFQNLTFSGHFDSNANKVPMLPSVANSALFGFGYGITDRFALSVDLPYVATRFTGLEAPVNDTVLDNRSYLATTTKCP